MVTARPATLRRHRRTPSGNGSIHVSALDRRLLQWLVRARVASDRIALRARIVLAADEGWSNCRIARVFGTSRPTVLLWRRRFAVHGIGALLKEAPRPGRPRRTGGDLRCQAVPASL